MYQATKADLKPGTKVFILRALAFAAIASAI
jgi:hypothetical protein